MCVFRVCVRVCACTHMRAIRGFSVRKSAVRRKVYDLPLLQK